MIKYGVFNNAYKFTEEEHKTDEDTKSLHLIGREQLQEEFPFIPIEQETLEETVPATAYEIMRNGFREIIREHSDVYSLVDTEGDGNCFYRAIVKSFTPNIPRDYEDSISLFLRQTINDNEKINNHFKDFEGQDTQSMKSSGTWADNVQIAKASCYLRTEIWIFRCEDKGVQISREGVLQPSAHNCFTSTTNEKPFGTPIRLLYQNEPGHFEPIIEKASNKKMEDYLQHVSAKIPPRECLLYFCDAFFVMEQSYLSLERDYRKASSLEIEERMLLKQKVGEDREKLLGLIKKYKQVLHDFLANFPKGFATKLMEAPEYVIFGETFKMLVKNSKIPFNEEFASCKIFLSVFLKCDTEIFLKLLGQSACFTRRSLHARIFM